MGCDASLANTDLPIRKELAKMIVCPTVPQTQLKHLTI
jgi:hypothetical protein